MGNLIVYLAATLHEQTWDELNDHLAIEIVENCDPAHIRNSVLSLLLLMSITDDLRNLRNTEYIEFRYVTQNAMQLAQIIQEILKTRQVTPALEQQIDSLLWSQEFDDSEMEALKRLEKLLSDGSVAVG